MPSKGVRLIAWVALAAFLVANGTAIAHHTLPSSACRCGDASCRPSPDNSPSSTCQHCRAKQKRSSVFGLSQGNDKRQVSFSRPSCPCEHPNPTKSPCSCPGGCMFCSVAKAPCSAPLVLSPVSITSTGSCLAEVPFLYLPPFYGKLIRPPRV